MFIRFIFWPWLVGLVFLIIALFAVRKELAEVNSFEKLLVLGRVFMAVPLAVFGTQHIVGAQFAARLVPGWIPWHLFWTYFVGGALFAAASSFILMKYVRLSAILLGLMFFLFVLLMHLPNAAANVSDRFVWAVALRDLAFAGGAWAFASTQRGSHSLAIARRLFIAVPLLFFAVEQFLHPEFVPGVPLNKITPTWIPAHSLWGYLTGAAELVAGVSILMNQRARQAAIYLGLFIALLCLFIYAPIWVAAVQPSQIAEGMNYLADTLLFAGAVLLLASAMPG